MENKVEELNQEIEKLEEEKRNVATSYNEQIESIDKKIKTLQDSVYGMNLKVCKQMVGKCIAVNGRGSRKVYHKITKALSVITPYGEKRVYFRVLSITEDTFGTTKEYTFNSHVLPFSDNIKKALEISSKEFNDKFNRLIAEIKVLKQTNKRNI